MSDFKNIAVRLGLRVKDMAVSHESLVSSVGGSHSGGVCGALTMLYLSRYIAKQGTDDPFEGKSFSTLLTEVQGSTKLKQLLNQLQNMESSRSDTFGIGLDKGVSNAEWRDIWAGVGFEGIFTANMGAMGAKKLTMEKANVGDFFSVTDTAPFAAIARYVSGHHGVHFIKLPNHYVGAVVDDNRLKFKFLDVNYGQAITTNAKAFRDFLEAYFASATVTGGLFSSGYNEKGQSAGVVHCRF